MTLARISQALKKIATVLNASRRHPRDSESRQVAGEKF